MRWRLCLLVAAGCGRLGFDAPGGDAQGAPPEAGADAPADGPASDAPGDGPASACRTSPLYRPLGALPHRYRIVSTQVRWTQARTACASDGAYLAIPNDATEAALLDADWVGLTDALTEGQWLTVFGDPAPYLPWEPGEPAGGTQENCARLSDGQLEARECTDERDYACECD